MGIRPEFFILMSEIEELWNTAKEDATMLRVNNALVENIVYCECCGDKRIEEDHCNPCSVCGYKKL